MGIRASYIFVTETYVAVNLELVTRAIRLIIQIAAQHQTPEYIMMQQTPTQLDRQSGHSHNTDNVFSTTVSASSHLWALSFGFSDYTVSPSVTGVDIGSMAGV